MLNKWLHNLSGVTKNYGHGDILDGAFYQIPSIAVRDRLASLESLFSDVSNGDIKLSLDGSTDYEGNSTAHWLLLIDGEVSIKQKDPDTGMLSTTPKWAPVGWVQRFHEIEFKTSQTNSIHDKTWQNVDTGFSSIKFYNAAGDEITDQGVIDTDCVRTEYDFMPPFDYAIKSGMIAQITPPDSAVYLWAIGAPGIANIDFCNGGINLEFVAARSLVGLEGTAATVLYYSHPLLGPGAGTNKVRFIVRHSAGLKHRIQVILEYFAA
jgi:hypothetical protein